MDQDTNKIFEQLKHEVTDLHFRWAIYRQLYASDKDVIDLLNKYGSNVFYLNQILLIDNVSLTLSKLTDPHIQGKNSNLSLEQLIEGIQACGDEELAKELRQRLEELKEACKKFRLLRNKRIAHADLGHSLKIEEEPLPGVSREDVEKSLKLIGEFMDAVDLKYFDNQTAYDLVIIPYDSDGNKLIAALRIAEKNS